MKLNLTMSSGKRADGQNRQENDFYATHPQAVRDFLDKLNKDGVKLNHNIWECACGEGHMAEVFEEYGYSVFATDLINRGYGYQKDFLKVDFLCKQYDIFTNPPFKLAEEFAYKGLELIREGCKLGLFLKIQFLESNSRKKLFEQYPPKYIYIYSQRQHCAMNGDFEALKAKTQCYCWVIWEKEYEGETITRWI